MTVNGLDMVIVLALAVWVCVIVMGLDSVAVLALCVKVTETVTWMVLAA